MAVLTFPFGRAAAAVAAAVLVWVAPAGGQPVDPGERALKAAFLYNFTKFVEWPAPALGAATTPFRVCVFVDAPFRREIEAMLAEETVAGRPLRVMTPDGAAVKGCHILYFGAGETERAAELLPLVRDAPVLTVGEGLRFLEQGGAVSFFVDENRVRFDVNKGAVDRARLSVSSKMLRVARQVRSGGRV